MDSFVTTLKNLGLAKLGIIGAVLLSIGLGFTMLGQKFSEPDMALMYAELDMADASKIVSRIEGMGIPVELRGAGTQIYVPGDKVARLRMDMAEAGLPRGGSVGYEIFDKTDTLGTTGFVQDINHLRAMEGELGRSISSLSQVTSARVHLVLPRRELFSRDRQQPSASIILKVSGPGRLNSARVQSIQHLVASAVPGLMPERVSIVDDQGNLLARGDSSSEAVVAANLEEMKVSYENRVSQTIENLVEKYVGVGKVRSEVSADLDFDRLTENTEKFDPDGQVLRSSQTVEEGDNSSDASGSKEVGVQNNLPNATAGSPGSATSQSKKTEETLNYEISKSVITHVKETGGVKRLSVAVMVDGTYTKGSDGKDIYKPRPAAEMEQLKKLISSAIGFSSERKDQLEVVNMRFVTFSPEGTESNAESTIMGFKRHDVIQLAEILVYGILGLLTLMLVIRPLLTRLMTSTVQPIIEGSIPLINNSHSSSTLALEGQHANQSALPKPQDNKLKYTNQLEETAENGNEKMITLDQIEGNLRASSIKKVGEIIEQRPDDAVMFIRNWMYEAK